jgi:hypothetical protein
VGLFSSVTKAFKQVTGAVVTGGLSIVAPKLVKPITSAINTIYDPKTILSAASTLAPGPLKLPAAFATTLVGGKPMGLNVGNILGQVGTIFGGGQNQVFSGISNVANLASQFFPQPSAQQIAVRPPSPIPMPGGILPRAGAMIGRSFFNRYPNLALVIQRWRDLGHKVTRAQLWSMLKRWGPEVLVSGGILTAAAVGELMVAGPGHRRMNAGNATALRRSLRRVEAFHRLCVRADKLRVGRRSSKRVGRSGSTFVRQG